MSRAARDDAAQYLIRRKRQLVGAPHRPFRTPGVVQVGDAVFLFPPHLAPGGRLHLINLVNGRAQKGRKPYAPTYSQRAPMDILRR